MKLIKSMRTQTALLISLSILLSCGGGGGGGGQETPRTSVDGRDEEQLELAASTALVGLSLSEGLVQLAQFGAKNIIKYQLEQTPTSSGIQVCSGGTADITFEDSDGNNIISSGDQFLIQTNECDNEILFSILTGDIRIEIVNYRVDNSGELAFESIIRYLPGFEAQNSDDTVVSIEGALELNYSLGGNEEMQITGLPGSDLTFQILDQLEKFNSFTVIKQTEIDVQGPKNVNLSTEIDVDSASLGTRVNCTGDEISFSQGSLFLADANFGCNGIFGEVEIRSGGNIYIELPGEAELTLTYTSELNELLEGAISSEALSVVVQT